MRMMIVRRRQLISHSVAVATQRGQRTLEVRGTPCTRLVGHVFGDFAFGCSMLAVEICKKERIIRKVDNEVQK